MPKKTINKLSAHTHTLFLCTRKKKDPKHMLTGQKKRMPIFFFFLMGVCGLGLADGFLAMYTIGGVKLALLGIVGLRHRP